jgi:hypothetical protein
MKLRLEKALLRTFLLSFFLVTAPFLGGEETTVPSNSSNPSVSPSSSLPSNTQLAKDPSFQNPALKPGNHTLVIDSFYSRRPTVDGISEEDLKFESTYVTFFGASSLYKISHLKSGIYHVIQDIGNSETEESYVDLTRNKDAFVTFKLGQASPNISYENTTAVRWLALGGLSAAIAVLIGIAYLFEVSSRNSGGQGCCF